MLFLDDDVYQETRDLALGKLAPHPMVVELADWFMTQHSVKVLNVHFGKDTVPGRYRLDVILENTADREAMVGTSGQKNVPDQQVESVFRELATQHGLAEDRHMDNMHVAYSDFSQEARLDANRQAGPHAQELILTKYPNVWRVMGEFDGVVVFYYRTEHVEKYAADGMSKSIEDEYYKVLKKYDVLDYFTRDDFLVSFESKQNLDENYEGDFFYYSRR